METTYDFLVALGLDETAQERDIRRAYARQLKQIDQELDPAAFQALRNAYETALDWARWKLAQEAEPAPADTPVDSTPTQAAPGMPVEQLPAQSEPEPEPEPEQEINAAKLGADVYHRFLAAASALVALPKHGEVAAWRAAIEARFTDEELVNIDARIYYEAYIAALLASGWRPGHEVLFVAAQEAFGWADDGRGLRQLGQAGRMLDQAIEERRLFEAQQPTDRARMRDLVKMLRQDELPAIRRIRAAMADVERMFNRFPAFMEVIAGMENVERWRTAYHESGGPPIVPDSEAMGFAPSAPERGFFSRNWAGIVILVIVALAILFGSAGRQDGRQNTQRRTSYGPFYQESGVAGIPDTVLRKSVPVVFYTPPPGKGTEGLEAVFKVYLKVNGKVERVQNWQTSGEPAFDRAVTRALMAAKPFPADVPREFEVRYTGEMTRRGEAPADSEDPSAAPPAPVPLTLAKLRKHLPIVHFTPAPNAKPGDYTGTYKVKLDASGKVSGFEVVKSSGILRLDQAVEEAAREAKPFAHGTAGFQFTYGTSIVEKKRTPRPQDAPQDAPPAEPPQAEPAQ